MYVRSARRNRLITSESSTSLRSNKSASVASAMDRRWRRAILAVASNGMQVSNVDAYAASEFAGNISDCRLLPFQKVTAASAAPEIGESNADQ
jgi:hypothetical protein